MSNTTAFTVPRVEKFVCDTDKSQTFYRDSSTPGLGLRVTKSGAKSYIFESKLSGRLTIGDTKTWKLDDAKKRATEFKIMVDKGIDPRVVAVEQQEQQQANAMQRRRQHVKVADVWTIYKADTSDSWGQKYKDLERCLSQPGGEMPKRGKKLTVRGPLADLLELTLPELTPELVGEWLKKESKLRATSTRKAWGFLRSFYNWCQTKPDYKNIIPADTFADKSVTKRVPKAKTRPGDCMQREHLPLWFKAVGNLDNYTHSVYLQALLITGARRNEMTAVRIHDVSFEFGGSITLRDKGTTSGENVGTRVIALTPYLCMLFKGLLPRQGEKRENDLLFYSPKSKEKNLRSPNRAHTKLLRDAGLPHVSLNGLRRSFQTLIEWVAVPEPVVDQIVGHKPKDVGEVHYKRRPLDLLRLHHCRFEKWLLQQAGIEFVYPVIEAPAPQLQLVA